MKVIEKQLDNHTIKIMVISHRFKGFPNIICSGSKNISTTLPNWKEIF